MQRNLTVDIDESTWPGPKLIPSFPPTFANGKTGYSLNIPAMLLMIGYLTTPTSSAGVSLSEFWAWVRYLAAIARQPNLSLTQSFWDLDAHQKTILSDDFGMGVPILWLQDKLSLVQIIDGRYFMQRVASSLGVNQARTAKRGPNKTPDFVALDTSGLWHVIECKGTQSGSQYKRKQLGSKGPPPQGGVAQKLSLQFPQQYTGQRLVCGLSIDVEGGAGSVLTIVDPEPKKPFLVDEHGMAAAKDAANRGVLARALRMVGLEVTAEEVASPFGPRISRRVGNARLGAVRSQLGAERERLFREEMGTILLNSQSFDGDFLGRETVVSLPRKITIDSQPVGRVVIRQGLHRDVLEELGQESSVDNLARQTRTVSWPHRMDKLVVQGHGLASSMRIGSILHLELELVA